MNFIIKTNPPVQIKMLRHKAFIILADVYNQSPNITESQKLTAKQFERKVLSKASKSPDLTCEFLEVNGIPFPVKFSVKRPKKKYLLNYAEIQEGSDFANACLARLKPDMNPGYEADAGLKRIPPKKLAENTKSSQSWPSKIASFMKHTVFHGLVAGCAYYLHQFVRPVLATYLPAVFLTPLGLVLSALGLSVSADAIRSYLKRSNLNAYKAKDDLSVQALTSNHIDAFSDGVAAQQGYFSYFKSFLSPIDYRHGNAFYAGMAAAENNEPELIRKVSAQKKVSA